MSPHSMTGGFLCRVRLSLGVRGDDRLIDEIVEVCRATVPVGE